MHKIKISRIVEEKVPGIELSCIECDVQVKERNADLWKIIERKIEEINSNLKIEEISQIPAIAASRRAYKVCGKDPARYRLSAEALLRRVLKRQEIYQVNNVVDLLNLVSISTGFSIGGYDSDKIEGEVVFGIGEKDEPYFGIGRGIINIEGMPVFRDKIGSFGTSTSDSVRTCVSEKTKRFLMIIIVYGSGKLLTDATHMAKEFLMKFANGINFEFETIKYD